MKFFFTKKIYSYIDIVYSETNHIFKFEVDLMGKLLTTQPPDRYFMLYNTMFKSGLIFLKLLLNAALQN